MLTCRTDGAPCRAFARARGFTLIELMVVLAIAAMVVAAGVPAVWRFHDGVRYRESIRAVYQAAATARYRAVTAGKPFDLVLQLEPAGYAVRPSASAREAAAFMDLPAELSLGAIVAREVTSDRRRPTIRFYPDGSSSGGTITMQRSRAGIASGAGVTLRVDWLHGRVSQEALL